MKVILTDEVKGKGREGDVVDVARGFAVNYLFPRRLAVEATAGNLKQLEARRTNIETREAQRRADAEALAAALEGKSVSIEAKAGEEGRLFGSVTSQMIEDAILDQLAIEVDRKKMDIGAHIKDVGEHDIAVRISHDVRATVTVRVIPEGGELEERASFLQDTERAVAQVEAAEAEEMEETEEVSEDLEAESLGETPAETSYEEPEESEAGEAEDENEDE